MKHRTFDFCANCKFSKRQFMYYGWLSCIVLGKLVRSGSKPCILYQHVDFKVDSV